jgi:hypothetical protein
MNILIMIPPKVILVSFFLLGFINIQRDCTKEYDLINHLACELSAYDPINQDFINWGTYNSINSYESLNPKNRGFLSGNGKIDLDEIFDENQRLSIDAFLKSKHPSKISSDSLNCKFELRKNKEYVRGLTTYSYSYPIISEGIDLALYGIIIESKSFEVDNNTITLKVFRKSSDSWKLVHELLLGIG